MHIAFETVLPNAAPGSGRAGCWRAAAFWWSLAHTPSTAERRARLEQFFFTGTPWFAPLFDASTFPHRGKVRTSEISKGRAKFRQYKVVRRCSVTAQCVARLVRVALDNSPHPTFFDASRAADVGGEAFRRDFLDQVRTLALADPNLLSMSLDRSYSVADFEGDLPAFNYRLPFARSLRTPAGQTFRQQIRTALGEVGSDLTPENIIDRAETQNCFGCHSKSGSVGGGVVLAAPFETGEHISDDTVTGDARLSPALNDVFLPYRVGVMRRFMEKENR